MINIIISCAGGSLKKYEALYFKKKSIFKNLINTIGVDFNKNSIEKKYFDFVETVPKTSNRKFLKKLRNIIIKYDVKFVFIGADEEAISISKNINKYSGFIALGCVIKGQTPHFDFISKASIEAIMKLSINSKKPIGNGIITCLNMKQAIARRTKGREAAVALKSILSQ